MRIRRFEAPSVQEALRQVRTELGPDAVILYTKKLRRGGFLGFGGNDVAEITAGLDDTGAEAAPALPASRPMAAAASAKSFPLPSAPRVRLRSEEGAERRSEVFQSELNDGKVLSGAFFTRPAAPKKQGSELHPELL